MVETGIRRAYFPANNSANVTFGFSASYEIMKGNLCHIMYDVAKTRSKYVFGTSIESFEKEDAIEVSFTNGTTELFDLLVGADGQASRIRRMMLGDGGADAFKPLGDLYIPFFTIPAEFFRSMYNV